jgi:hypothetical protein
MLWMSRWWSNTYTVLKLDEHCAVLAFPTGVEFRIVSKGYSGEAMRLDRWTFRGIGMYQYPRHGKIGSQYGITGSTCSVCVPYWFLAMMLLILPVLRLKVMLRRWLTSWQGSGPVSKMWLRPPCQSRSLL